jgi:hypothetical protein
MRREASIQSVFRDALIYCTDPNKVVAFHIPNEDASRSQRIHKARIGTVSGVPDYLVQWYRGQVFIEFKTSKGRLTKEQVDMHGRLGGINRRVVVCRSAEEALSVLAALGCPFKRSWEDALGQTRLKLPGAA